MEFDPSSLVELAKKICEFSIIGGNMSFLYESIAPEFQEKLSIGEIGKRLALAEEKSGMFKKIGDATLPQPKQDNPELFDLTVTLYSEKDSEWLAVFTMNKSEKITNFFFCHPFYIAPNYYNPHKVTTEDISARPLIRFLKPSMRRTSKIPIAVLMPSIFVFDIDGHMYSRYPWKDIEFLAQKKIGLIKFDGRTTESTNAIVDMAEMCANFAAKRREVSKVFLIIHSIAALFVPEILKRVKVPLGGLVLLNPAWEAPPMSGNPSMTAEKVPKDIPMLIIGCENDQLLVPDHWKLWTKAAPNATAKWYEKADHFLMDAPQIPSDDSYMKDDFHVNEKILRDIKDWIKEQDPQE